MYSSNRNGTKTVNKTFLQVLALFAALIVLTTSQVRADYPAKPITIVIPFSAGGSHDINSQVISSLLPAYLNTQVQVRLAPGDGGQIGTAEVANATSDGHTLLFTQNYVDMLQQFVKEVQYNPLEDFVPVARVNFATIAVVVRADSPYASFEDLIMAADQDAGGVRLSHSGMWGAFFVPAVQIMQAADVSFDLIPYQGGGPALQALLSGEADVTMGFPSTLDAQITAGEVRVLATAGEERTFEDVPTLAELGIEGDVGFMHRVLLAPKGTPEDAIVKLGNAIKELTEDPSFIRRMAQLNESIGFIDGNNYQTLREDQTVAYRELVDLITSQ